MIEQTSSVRNEKSKTDIKKLMFGTGDVPVKATINHFRHFIIIEHVKFIPRKTIATSTAARKGNAHFGYNLNSERSVISVWRFTAADLLNSLFLSIMKSYAVVTFHNAEHAKVAKSRINVVHHVSDNG